MSSQGVDLLEALAGQPGGSELLGLAENGAETAVVGGAVRDMMIGRAPRELDVVLPVDVAQFAAELAARIELDGGGDVETTLHERFGTALLEWRAGRIDIAQRRTETYAAPGALPDVRPGTLAEDLARRDFTINAIAVPLGGPDRGELICVAGALEDLQARLLRVLHDQSFIDDPTRLLRLARYQARLGFEVEGRTAELARAAIDGGALQTVSGVRLGAELRLALGEADAVAALSAMDELGLLSALSPHLHFDHRLALAALMLLAAASGGEGTPRPELLLVSALLLPAALGPESGTGIEPKVEQEMRELLDELQFTAAERDLVLRAAISVEANAEALAHAETASQVYEAASYESLEAIALAGAWDEQRGGLEAGCSAHDWLAEMHSVRLLITGEDLLAAGVPEGPEIGKRLTAALHWKLDEPINATVDKRPVARGRQAELDAALGAEL
jgi:tRNA nucleotidyltransferase (CCA-adding enzyme)